MKLATIVNRLTTLAALLFCINVASADTTAYTGSGTYEGVVVQMTLANGDTITGIRVDALGTISTSPPALLIGRCMGMGLLPPEGKESDYQSGFYCTFRQNETDAFDFKGTDKLGGITIEIIGGSGKWENASGHGTMERLRHEVGSGEFSYAFEITTP